MKSSISKKILLGVVIASAAITIFVTAFQLIEDYNSQIEVKYSQFDTLMHVNGRALNASVWDLNSSQIESILEGYVAHPSVTYLELNYESIGGNAKKSIGKNTSDSLRKTYQLQMDEKVIGDITFFSSKKQIYNFLLKDLFKILFINAIKTFLASFLILYTVNQLLTKHLIIISNFIARAEQGKVEHELSLKRFGGDQLNEEDELSQLVRSINGYFAKSKELELLEVSRIVASTPSCMKILNREGELIQMNEAGLEMIGAENLESVQGSCVFDLIEKSYLNDFKRMHELVCNGEKQSLEFQISNLAGKKVWMETYAAPYILPDGEVGHIAITNDVSEKVRTKQEMEKQRKINLHNSKLASIGELAAGVGHEINNPLAIAKGHLDILNRNLSRHEVADEKIDKSINKIENAISRITKIVKGLRTFSRTDSTEIEDFDPIAVITESVELVEEIYLQEEIKIKFNHSLHEGGFFVHGNRGHFQQVLVNLISNARDATRETEVKDITITAEECTSGGWLNLFVADTGKGIPPEIRDSIFDPFFTTKEVNKGTGIGLSITQNYIKDLKGKISVESTVGVGTKFKLELPLQSRSKAQVVEVSTGDSQEQLHGNVLLVEDEEGIREILADTLEEFGLAVTPAENGEVAFDLYLQTPEKFDLIISDMKMPKMDGPTLLRSIRGKELPQPKFVFLTGGVNADFENKSSELNQLLDGYFFKPFDDETVYKAISEVLTSKTLKKAS